MINCIVINNFKDRFNNDDYIFATLDHDDAKITKISDSLSSHTPLYIYSQSIPAITHLCSICLVGLSVAYNILYIHISIGIIVPDGLKQLLSNIDL